MDMREYDHKKIDPPSLKLRTGKKKLAEYNHLKLERKWQKEWEKRKIYQAKDLSKAKKFYSLIEFPYPSGDGLHVGHPRPYIGMDVISRKKRMQGFNVLYPIGWDAFGLPTENYAIKTGKDPRVVTKENSTNFKRQIQSIGISFDWSREINTTDPKYYKWTQWIFLQFLKKGLAYKAKMAINWCSSCKIGLANEEVVTRSTSSGQAGCCERCGTAVEKREKEQWMLAITKYAERLDKDLDTVDYLPQIKLGQRNWIGRKVGININYKIENIKKIITCFTTRPDTNFGATFVVLGPEHPLLKEREILNIDLSIWQKIKNYKEKTTAETETERIAENRKKTGVFTGLYCINNLNNYHMPLYVADYVLGNVGTGAVVGVPGHDKRDFEFAQSFNIPVIRVVKKNDKDTGPITDVSQVQEDEGTMINSEFLNGLDIHEATKKIMDYMEENNYGKRVVNFKLRDWIFSRQRYWGEPIPVIHCENCRRRTSTKTSDVYNAGWVSVPEKDLPVKLPKVKNYQPTDSGESPLANILKWVNTTCPTCGGKAKRETDTMPNWAGSSWYYLRYTDPKNKKEFASQKNLKYWTPVDWYNGGMEHTTLHLLYSRFWHKFLFDLKLVPTSEPYMKRTSHGLILAEGGEKMSKSKGNVINPDDIVERYGADTLRLYEMFMGPFDQAIAWSEEAMVGPRRFLERVWKFQFRLKENKVEVSQFIINSINLARNNISRDIESMKFNTAVSQLMILLNYFEKQNITIQIYETFLQLLAPLAPHITEEIWFNLGHKKSIHLSDWPRWRTDSIQDEEIKIVVQVNGKVRAQMFIPIDTPEENIKEQVLKDKAILKYTMGKDIKRVVYVKNRL